MTNAIFYHKHDSIYDDDPATRYHFPKQYLSRVEQTLKDWIIYYGPIKGMPSRYYTATALVKDILKDNKTENHYYASIQSGTYLDFDHPLEYSKDGEMTPFKTELHYLALFIGCSIEAYCRFLTTTTY